MTIEILCRLRFNFSHGLSKEVLITNTRKENKKYFAELKRFNAGEGYLFGAKWHEQSLFGVDC